MGTTVFLSFSIILFHRNPEKVPWRSGLWFETVIQTRPPNHVLTSLVITINGEKKHMWWGKLRTWWIRQSHWQYNHSQDHLSIHPSIQISTWLPHRLRTTRLESRDSWGGRTFRQLRDRFSFSNSTSSHNSSGTSWTTEHRRMNLRAGSVWDQTRMRAECICFLLRPAHGRKLQSPGDILTLNKAMQLGSQLRLVMLALCELLKEQLAPSVSDCNQLCLYTVKNSNSNMTFQKCISP